MSSRPIDSLLIDDENEDKFWRNGVSPKRVLQVLDNPHLLVNNRARRRAPLLLIGNDHGGACLAIPIEPTHQPGLWRPVTAWPCKPREQDILKERSSK